MSITNSTEQLPALLRDPETEARLLNYVYDSWDRSSEEARTIHELFKSIELSDIERVGQWQDERNEQSTAIRVANFPGDRSDGLLDPFDFALATTGCSLHFKLVGPLGKLSLDPATFSRLSLVGLTESQTA